MDKNGRLKNLILTYINTPNFPKSTSQKPIDVYKKPSYAVQAVLIAQMVKLSPVVNAR